MTYSFHLQPSERFAFVFRAGLKGRNTLYAGEEKKGGCRYQANIGSQKVKGSCRLASCLLTYPSPGGSCLQPSLLPVVASPVAPRRATPHRSAKEEVLT